KMLGVVAKKPMSDYE
uniref:Cytochrome c oxidase subunit 6C-2 (Fragments) n=1 Tax=Thunnus obesus TaxID=8241 RepID=CX6C2_THUOB|nr:RecName: Full=Cytochrome c oxidase subunit 6C-2; AltName: Full=Cytochrome c oxidase polypeptide VIc-2 [Thunnus obesus]